jgi:hypothetical protein
VNTIISWCDLFSVSLHVSAYTRPSSEEPVISTYPHQLIIVFTLKRSYNPIVIV